MERTPDFHQDQFLTLLFEDLRNGHFLDTSVAGLFGLGGQLADLLYREICGEAVGNVPPAARRAGPPAPALRSPALPPHRVTAAARDAGINAVVVEPPVIRQPVVSASDAMRPSITTTTSRTKKRASSAAGATSRPTATVATTAAKQSAAVKQRNAQVTTVVADHGYLAYEEDNISVSTRSVSPRSEMSDCGLDGYNYSMNPVMGFNNASPCFVSSPGGQTHLDMSELENLVHGITTSTGYMPLYLSAENVVAHVQPYSFQQHY
jgi:hypothetical protein